MLESRHFGPISAFCSSLTWAAGTAAYTAISRSHTPFSVNIARALTALPLFLILAFASAGGVEAGLAQFAALQPSQLGWFALAMLASYGIGDCIFMWSAGRIGLPGALAIASSYPIWTTLGGAVFKGEAITLLQALGLVIAVSGIIVVILTGPKAPGQAMASARSVRVGILLAFIASFFWATNAFSISHVGREVPQLVGNTVRMAFALLISLTLSRLLAKGSPILLPGPVYRRYAWAFVLEGFGGSLFFLYGLSHSSLAVGAVLTSLAPVVSVPVAVAFGLERFSLMRTAGVTLVVVGIALLFA